MRTMIQDSLKYTLPEVVRGAREDALRFIASLIGRGRFLYQSPFCIFSLCERQPTSLFCLLC